MSSRSRPGSRKCSFNSPSDVSFFLGAGPDALATVLRVLQQGTSATPDNAECVANLVAVASQANVAADSPAPPTSILVWLLHAITPPEARPPSAQWPVPPTLYDNNGVAVAIANSIVAALSAPPARALVPDIAASLRAAVVSVIERTPALPRGPDRWALVTAVLEMGYVLLPPDLPLNVADRSADFAVFASVFGENNELLSVALTLAGTVATTFTDQARVVDTEYLSGATVVLCGVLSALVALEPLSFCADARPVEALSPLLCLDAPAAAAVAGLWARVASVRPGFMARQIIASQVPAALAASFRALEIACTEPTSPARCVNPQSFVALATASVQEAGLPKVDDVRRSLRDVAAAHGVDPAMLDALVAIHTRCADASMELESKSDRKMGEAVRQWITRRWKDAPPRESDVEAALEVAASLCVPLMEHAVAADDRAGVTTAAIVTALVGLESGEPPARLDGFVRAGAIAVLLLDAVSAGAALETATWCVVLRTLSRGAEVVHSVATSLCLCLERADDGRLGPLCGVLCHAMRVSHGVVTRALTTTRGLCSLCGAVARSRGSAQAAGAALLLAAVSEADVRASFLSDPDPVLALAVSSDKSARLAGCKAATVLLRAFARKPEETESFALSLWQHLEDAVSGGPECWVPLLGLVTDGAAARADCSFAERRRFQRNLVATRHLVTRALQFAVRVHSATAADPAPRTLAFDGIVSLVAEDIPTQRLMAAAGGGDAVINAVCAGAATSSVELVRHVVDAVLPPLSVATVGDAPHRRWVRQPWLVAPLLRFLSAERPPDGVVVAVLQAVEESWESGYAAMHCDGHSGAVFDELLRLQTSCPEGPLAERCDLCLTAALQSNCTPRRLKSLIATVAATAEGDRQGTARRVASLLQTMCPAAGSAARSGPKPPSSFIVLPGIGGPSGLRVAVPHQDTLPPNGPYTAALWLRPESQDPRAPVTVCRLTSATSDGALELWIAAAQPRSPRSKSTPRTLQWALCDAEGYEVLRRDTGSVVVEGRWTHMAVSVAEASLLQSRRIAVLHDGEVVDATSVKKLPSFSPGMLWVGCHSGAVCTTAPSLDTAAQLPRPLSAQVQGVLLTRCALDEADPRLQALFRAGPAECVPLQREPTAEEGPRLLADSSFQGTVACFVDARFTDGTGWLHNATSGSGEAHPTIALLESAASVTVTRPLDAMASVGALRCVVLPLLALAEDPRLPLGLRSAPLASQCRVPGLPLASADVNRCVALLERCVAHRGVREEAASVNAFAVVSWVLRRLAPVLTKDVPLQIFTLVMHTASHGSRLFGVATSHLLLDPTLWADTEPDTLYCAVQVVVKLVEVSLTTRARLAELGAARVWLDALARATVAAPTAASLPGLLREVTRLLRCAWASDFGPADADVVAAALHAVRGVPGAVLSPFLQGLEQSLAEAPSAAIEHLGKRGSVWPLLRLSYHASQEVKADAVSLLSGVLARSPAARRALASPAGLDVSFVTEGLKTAQSAAECVWTAVRCAVSGVWPSRVPGGRVLHAESGVAFVPLLLHVAAANPESDAVAPQLEWLAEVVGESPDAAARVAATEGWHVAVCDVVTAHVDDRVAAAACTLTARVVRAVFRASLRATHDAPRDAHGLGGASPVGAVREMLAFYSHSAKARAAKLASALLSALLAELTSLLEGRDGIPPWLAAELTALLYVAEDDLFYRQPDAPPPTDSFVEWDAVAEYVETESMARRSSEGGAHVWLHCGVAADALSFIAKHPALLTPPAIPAPEDERGCPHPAQRDGGVRRLAVRLFRCVVAEAEDSAGAKAACAAIVGLDEAWTTATTAPAPSRFAVVKSAIMRRPDAPGAVKGASASALSSTLSVLAVLLDVTRRERAHRFGRRSDGRHSAKTLAVAVSTLKQLTERHRTRLQHLVTTALPASQHSGAVRCQQSRSGKPFTDGMHWLLDPVLADAAEFRDAVLPLPDTQALVDAADEAALAAAATSRGVAHHSRALVADALRGAHRSVVASSQLRHGCVQRCEDAAAGFEESTTADRVVGSARLQEYLAAAARFDDAAFAISAPTTAHPGAQAWAAFVERLSQSELWELDAPDGRVPWAMTASEPSRLLHGGFVKAAPGTARYKPIAGAAPTRRRPTAAVVALGEAGDEEGEEPTEEAMSPHEDPELRVEEEGDVMEEEIDTPVPPLAATDATVMPCEIVANMMCWSARVAFGSRGFAVAADDTNTAYNQVVADDARPFLPLPPATASYRWSAVAEVAAHRRFRMRRSAVEVRLRDGTPLLLNFGSEATAAEAVAEIRRRLAKSVGRVRWWGDARDIRPYTAQWLRGELSNLEYLLLVNYVGGRSLSDLTQYPVVPWVLADYTSPAVDWNGPATFRDLGLPVGLLGDTARRREEVAARYQDLEELDQAPFHYFTHYSSAAVALHFLVRAEPYAGLHVVLQGGRFDHADRMFHGIAASFDGVRRNHQDVKELVPELFACPEVLCNRGRLSFGTRQEGQPMDDVDLPPWARGCPRRFVHTMRRAMEHERVTAQLHRWIDLVFGAQQRGKAARQAFNMFHPHTYEHHAARVIAKADAATGAEGQAAAEQEQRLLVDTLDNMGQCPVQLFTRPHPARKGPFPLLPSDAPERLAARPVVVATDATAASCALVGGHFALVTAEGGALLYDVVARTVPSSSKPGDVPAPELGNLAATCPPLQSGLVAMPRLGGDGPAAKAPRPHCVAFLATADGRAVYAAYAGLYNNACLLRNLRTRTELHLVPHRARITCIAASPDSSVLVTGSADTTCAFYAVALTGSTIRLHQAHVCHDHRDALTTVAVSTKVDLVVSGASDGRLCLHRALGVASVSNTQTPTAPVRVACTRLDGPVANSLILDDAFVPAVWACGSTNAGTVTMLSVHGEPLGTFDVAARVTDWALGSDPQLVAVATSTGVLHLRSALDGAPVHRTRPTRSSSPLWAARAAGTSSPFVRGRGCDCVACLVAPACCSVCRGRGVDGSQAMSGLRLVGAVALCCELVVGAVADTSSSEDAVDRLSFAQVRQHGLDEYRVAKRNFGLALAGALLLIALLLAAGFVHLHYWQHAVQGSERSQAQARQKVRFAE